MTARTIKLDGVTYEMTPLNSAQTMIRVYDGKQFMENFGVPPAHAARIAAALAPAPLDPLSVRLLAALESVKGMVNAYLEDYEQGLGDGTYDGDAENRANFAAYQRAQADMYAAIAAAKAAPAPMPGSHAAFLSVVLEALEYERAAFEADTEVNGGDLVEWFSGWREEAKAAVGDKPPLVVHSVATYTGQPDHENTDGFDKTSIEKIALEVCGDQPAVLMSRPGAEINSPEAPYLFIERRPGRWFVGVHADHNDPLMGFDLTDDRRVVMIDNP